MQHNRNEFGIFFFKLTDAHHLHPHQQQEVIIKIPLQDQQKHQFFEHVRRHVFPPHPLHQVNILYPIGAAYRKWLIKYDQFRIAFYLRILHEYCMNRFH